MTLDDVRNLFSYTEWANEEIIATMRTLDDEQRASVRDVVAHIIMAEWIWLRRWKGESPNAEPPWCTGSLDVLVENLRAIESERRAFIDALSDDELQAGVAYRSMKGDPFTTRLVHQLQHVANHSTYHRGQAAMKIRALGVQPPTTDLIHWYRTR
ncbi:MAG TPA: DinB family protein [Thermoanaerobaculia bacterium]|nr:DinB family protein [Thermoanaerobaculia bacterium]